VLDKIPGYLDKKIMGKVLVFFSEKYYKTKKWKGFEKKLKVNCK
jgi:thioredoxin-related protein